MIYFPVSFLEDTPGLCMDVLYPFVLILTFSFSNIWSPSMVLSFMQVEKEVWKNKKSREEQ